MSLLVVAFSILPIVAGIVPEASADPPTLVLGRNRIGEFQGVQGEHYLAWQQNTRAHPRHYDVYARPIDAGETFRVNAPGTNAANGGIDGDVLVYQQFGGGGSDIRLFDLANRSRTQPPSGVNTKHWEYWPSLSGTWLLFGRLDHDGTRRVVLFDLVTGRSRNLATTHGPRPFLAPGQVNGDYAVYSRCKTRNDCEVVRYHIPDQTKDVIPSSGGSQHAPSVTPDGTVFFALSGRDCGARVRVMRDPPNGPATVLWRLPSGDDVGTTRAYVSPQGKVSLYYDHYACGLASISDVWKIDEQGPIQLSVTVDGDASGTVTSSPSGISCGSDCSEVYDSVTGVTLTATPQGNAVFAGWGGACTGSAKTCSLTIDGPKSVTATFTTKPVLNVSKGGIGDGTITSVPAGINCGTDCNEPYNNGTTVTLTATADSTSTFAGWSGACGGTGSCTVTMNGSQAVTATFDPVAQSLSVTVDGDGEGTVMSNPGSIDCPGTCQDTFAPGTVVTLTASEGTQSTFVGWGGDCSGTADCTVTMNGSRTVTATFTAVDQVLSVSVTGDGTVTSDVGGISCPATSCSDSYPSGTPVSLTATLGPSATTVDWGGDCAGTIGLVCPVTMSSDRSVSATFS